MDISYFLEDGETDTNDRRIQLSRTDSVLHWLIKLKWKRVFVDK